VTDVSPETSDRTPCERLATFSAIIAHWRNSVLPSPTSS
jgi:hypothetical protein